MRPHTTAILAVGVLLSSGLLGCTPEKAQALRTAATQFKSEALAATNAIELLMRKEVEPVPRSDAQAAKEFADNILALQEPADLTRDIILIALDPYRVASDPEMEKQRAEFLADLRLQYSTFASIFDELEAGSFLARDAVKRAGEPARKLTAQMAAFGKAISENPPILLQYQADLISRMQNVRLNGSMSPEQKRAALVELREQWLLMEAGEQELQRNVMEQCAKAATLGVEVSRLTEEYDRLSLQDLNLLINRALDAAGQLTGKNTDTLKTKAGEIFARVQQDPALQLLASEALRKINGARAPAN